MNQKSHRPFGLVAAVAVFAFLAGCASSGAADPTSETSSSAESAITSAFSSQTVTSDSQPRLSTGESVVTTIEATSEVTEPSMTEAPPTSNPWPDTFTPEQVVDAQAAVDALMGYSALTDAAFADPGKDWSEEIKKWAGDPARTEFIDAIQGTAALGQYGTGTVEVYPTVTNVAGAVADLTVCFDSTNVGFFDKNGSSIKAPDAPGSYLRHPAQVEVARYASGVWLVTTVVDDYSKTC